MKSFFKIKKALDKVIELVMGIAVLVMCLIVIWQVFSRFILSNPSSWSEEVSRYLLICISMVGGTLGLCNGTHIGLTIVTDRIKSPVLKLLFRIATYLVCGVVGYVFVKYGYIYAMGGMARTMMCCKFPMGYIYMSVPVGGVIIIINSLTLLLSDLSSFVAERKLG